MCSISGFYNPHETYLEQENHWRPVLEQMALAGKRRGPDELGLTLWQHLGLAHTRLSVIDPVSGQQPMTRTRAGETFSITYNGELYNAGELKASLTKLGHVFETASDTEVVLTGFMEQGPDFLNQMNGIFAFGIAEKTSRRLWLFRDRAGVKPLFFMPLGNTLLFGSEPKNIFAFPDAAPAADRQSLNEIFSLGPARTPGCGIYRGLSEVLPRHVLLCTPEGRNQSAYWRLESHEHTDSFEETVERTSFLIQDAVKRQMVSDVPVCAFLSGGLDSSLVSALCAGELRKSGQALTTFSFDFTDNERNFTPNAFQPSQDGPYARKMAEFLGTDHHVLTCTSRMQADGLYASVLAHDLPAMGDIDSSLLTFCSQVKISCKVALTGECADEIFGGYPWFHKQECFDCDTFPWTMDLGPRKLLLKDDFLHFLEMDEYVRCAYETSVAETPVFSGDSPKEARRREISWLNQRWFMQTLLNRMDRTSMYCGLEARVPFADHRILEYLWNVPWEMKAKDGIVKGLLRQAAADSLPPEILNRKKSPYPKTYDRGYEALLAERMRSVMLENGPVMEFLDREKLENFLISPSDYGKPWYGQLMAGPQMIAWLLQVNFWLSHYKVKLIL